MYKLEVDTHHTIKGEVECVEIDKQYVIYPDGVIYDTINADDDIPEYVFQLRDFIMQQLNGEIICHDMK